MPPASIHLTLRQMSPRRVLHAAWKRSFLRLSLLLTAFFCMRINPLCAEDVQTPLGTAFFENYCFDCHQGDEAEAGLDLESISNDLSQSEALIKWVRIFDRIHEGEMPPPDYNVIESDERSVFLGRLGLNLRLG